MFEFEIREHVPILLPGSIFNKHNNVVQFTNEEIRALNNKRHPKFEPVVREWSVGKSNCYVSLGA